MNARSQRFTRFVMGLSAVAAVFAASSAAAEHRGLLDDRGYVSVGAFFLNTDTTMRVDGVLGRGTHIDFSEDLGFDDEDRLRVDGFWRFARRHKLRFLYFRNTLSAERSLHREIRFRDTIYPISVHVAAQFDTETAEAVYEYAFVQRDRFELSGTLGMHLMRFGVELAGEGSQMSVGTIQARSKASGKGPLPVLGLRGLWQIGNNVYVDAQAQFLALDADQYRGRLEDYKVALIWQALAHIGAGIAYNRFSTRLDGEARHFHGELRFEYEGPLAFLTASF